MRMSMSSSIFFGVVVVFFFCLSLSSLSSLNVSAQSTKEVWGVFCPLSNDDDDDDAQKKKRGGGAFFGVLFNCFLSLSKRFVLFFF